jgi:hypothetical protein
LSQFDIFVQVGPTHIPWNTVYCIMWEGGVHTSLYVTKFTDSVY